MRLIEGFGRSREEKGLKMHDVGTKTVFQKTAQLKIPNMGMRTEVKRTILKFIHFSTISVPSCFRICMFEPLRDAVALLSKKTPKLWDSDCGSRITECFPPIVANSTGCLP